MYGKCSIMVTALLLSLTFACGGDDSPAGPSSMDRDKFIGNWAGTYQCTNLPGDTLTIAFGTGDLGFNIILHASTGDPNPEIVTGELTGVSVITIPEQTIGGFPGSGEITYSNNMLLLSQKGFGITCNGTNYLKF